MPSILAYRRFFVIPAHRRRRGSRIPIFYRAHATRICNIVLIFRRSPHLKSISGSSLRRWLGLCSLKSLKHALHRFFADYFVARSGSCGPREMGISWIGVSPLKSLSHTLLRSRHLLRTRAVKASPCLFLSRLFCFVFLVLVAGIPCRAPDCSLVRCIYTYFAAIFDKFRVFYFPISTIGRRVGGTVGVRYMLNRMLWMVSSGLRQDHRY